MLARALLVLLIVLNVGVAIWWMARPADAPAAPAHPLPANVPSLKLLREVPVAQRPAPPPPAAPATADAGAGLPLPIDAPAAASTDAVAAGEPAAAPAERCLAFGPFAEAAQVASARSVLQPLAMRLHERRAGGTAGRGWRVWLPPQADRAAAQALAARISAAGFDDFIVVNTGDEANSVALGRYGNETAARQRESALRAGGFTDAVATPVGTQPEQTWLDVAAAATFDPAAPLRSLRGAQAKPIDCKSVP